MLRRVLRSRRFGGSVVVCNISIDDFICTLPTTPTTDLMFWNTFVGCFYQIVRLGSESHVEQLHVNTAGSCKAHHDLCLVTTDQTYLIVQVCKYISIILIIHVLDDRRARQYHHSRVSAFKVGVSFETAVPWRRQDLPCLVWQP